MSNPESPSPYDALPAALRARVRDELHRILAEEDPRKADADRERLVDSLRADHPRFAEWLQGQSGPPVEEVSGDNLVREDPERVAALQGQIVLIKYGGNAMIDEERKEQVLTEICSLKSRGLLPVVVHGGGPVISRLLKEVGVETPFVAGHRKTDQEAMGYVEMALSGKVNSEIVKSISCHGMRAAGISGKDGGLVTARKRIHKVKEGNRVRRSNLGQVGDVESVQPHLLHTLLDADYIPVVAPIGVGADLEDYNINADIFAGHLAAALKARAFYALTDVDGLYLDIKDPSSRIPRLSARAARTEIGRIIKGGMIPKVEACLTALEGGVAEARILSGMRREALLLALLGGEEIGTRILWTPDDSQ